MSDPTVVARVARVTDLAAVLLAPNPGPMTLDGTNSYLLGARGAGRVVVDPGPDDPGHLTRLAAAGPVELILVTHRHGDHTAGAAALAELTGAPVRGADPNFCVGAPPLADGEVVDVAGVRLTVLATPGHTADSVCVLVADDGRHGSVLTGDTVLGRGTAVIAHPDGSLGPYLASLRRLAGLGPAAVLPGHGPQLADLRAVATQYLRHRLERLDQVRAAVAGLRSAGAPITVAAVTDAVYADIDPSVRFAAERSVAAQLDYLVDAGELPVAAPG